MNQNSDNEFPSTSFSLLSQMQRACPIMRKQALEKFVESYRPALIAFLVRQKHISLSRAEDLVHEFIICKIMNGKVLDLANEKGRFRSVLRVCLQRYWIDSIRREAREPVAGAQSVHELEPETSLSAEPLDQVWAIAIFSQALKRMRHQSEYWGLFFDRVLTQPPLPYTEVVQKYCFGNPQIASNCLITAKRQFNRIMQDTVMEQSALAEETTEAEMRAELEYLRQQLADSRLVASVVDTLGPLTLSSKQQDSEPILSPQFLADESPPCFVNESPDANWGKSDALQMLSHLLEQSPQHFVQIPVPPTMTLFELMKLEPAPVGLAKLAEIAQVKEFFNGRGKGQSGEFPKRVAVAMTLAATASYLVNGGKLHQVTSTKPDILMLRLQQLQGKDWLPQPIVNLIGQAATILRQIRGPKEMEAE